MELIMIKMLEHNGDKLKIEIETTSGNIWLTASDEVGHQSFWFEKIEDAEAAFKALAKAKNFEVDQEDVDQNTEEELTETGKAIKIIQDSMPDHTFIE